MQVSIVSTNRSVSVSFDSTFSGSVSVKTQFDGSISLSGGSCSVGSDQKVGAHKTSSASCRSDLFEDALMTIEGKESVTVNFGSPACSTGWSGDPRAVGAIPKSPPMALNRPGLNSNLSGVSNWGIYSDWSPQDSTFRYEAPSGFSWLAPSFWPSRWWVFGKIDLLLPASRTFDASATISGRCDVSSCLNLPNITSVRYYLLEYSESWPTSSVNDAKWTDLLGSRIANASGQVTSRSASSLRTTFSFTTTKSFNNARIVMLVQCAESPGNDQWRYSLTNVELVQRPYAWLPVSTITPDSQYVTIPKMDLLSEPSYDEASCPHTRVGLRLWHDATVWPNGILPDSASTITIPFNTSILVTSCSLTQGAVYQSIVVPESSSLIFADAPIRMRLRNLLVQGKLLLGSPSCRLKSKIIIEFVGPKTASNEMGGNFGSKGIAVSSSGSIDIHGYLFHPTWTRLSSAIIPGDDRVYLADAVNWHVGQKIVVATSIYKDFEMDQNEVVTIVSVSDDGKVLQVSPAFAFSHYSGIEYQTEVGLLSRRIVLQGDAQSEDEKFGGHIMVRFHRLFLHPALIDR
jgi:hypothetical protein